VTALGTITIRAASSVYEARRKIYGLAMALGFDEIGAVRLATAASQVCRALAAGDGSGRIEVALQVAGERAGLVLDFLGRGGVETDSLLATLFDSIEPMRREEEGAGSDAGVRAVKWLPPGAGVPAPERLEVQQERLRQRSREELMEEIRAKNAALERHSAELERAVAERTLELRHAMEAADAANRAKSQFLSNMSHELRTPLNGVLGYAQILQRDPAVTPKQRRSLESIHSCGQHLLTLINDVLDLSKIESGRLDLDPAPCDLPQLLRSVHDIVRPRAEGRQLAFRLEIEPDVPQGIVTDKTKLKQTIVNLAGNAVKFTEQGSVVLRARRDGGDVVFEVRDTGIGMTPEEAVSVFEPFQQAEGGRTHGGTGLGLSISKRIVEALGGSVSVVSQKGVGSTFTVRLPLQETQVLCPAIAADVITEGKDLVLGPGQDIQVLIADDVPANRDILVTVLEDAGFRTLEAENGRQVVELLRQHRCPIVLMDVRMPVMDGIQATALIRAEPALAATKVIAVTASVIDYKDRATDDGFDDLVGKPVRVEELFEAIRRHLGVRYLERGAVAGVAAPGAAPSRSPAPTVGAAAPAVTVAAAAASAPVAPAGVRPEAGADIAARLRAALRLRNLTASNALSAQLAASPGTAQVGQRIGDLAQSFDFKGLDHLAGQIEAVAGLGPGAGG
jgi:signal transduction histidine kinase/DNA-binding NarL/FixJ family response regulator